MDLALGPDTALVIVDVQNDFADPAGSLHVEGGEDIVEPINAVVRSAHEAGATIAYTQDWHPPETAHFVTGGGTWPVHCVRETWGAELHPGLSRVGDAVIRKGTGGEDGYSGFGMRDPETGDESSTGLAGLLRDRGVERVVVVGLAADVCVKATALDAHRLGFETTVPEALTRGVDMEAGDTDAALAELRTAGIAVI